MKVQEAWDCLFFGGQKGNHFITGIKHIVATSPFTMNNNEFVIGDKFIAGLNAVCGVAISSMLKE